MGKAEISEVVDILDKLIKATARMSCSVEEKKILAIFLEEARKKLLHSLAH
jgi:hypothetical protein